MEDCKPFRQKPICPLPVKEIKEHKKEGKCLRKTQI